MTEREELFHLATHSNNPAWRWLPNNAEMLRSVDYLIANGVTIRKWIPVTERLPEKEGNYLVLSKNRNYSVRTFLIYDEVRKEFIHIENGVITHWMPLPSTEGLE